MLFKQFFLTFSTNVLLFLEYGRSCYEHFKIIENSWTMSIHLLSTISMNFSYFNFELKFMIELKYVCLRTEKVWCHVSSKFSNCSREKFEAIIVNVLVFFMQNFCLTVFAFSRTFFDILSDFFTLQFFVFE